MMMSAVWSRQRCTVTPDCLAAGCAAADGDAAARTAPGEVAPCLYALPALLAAEQAAAAGVPGGAIAEPVLEGGPATEVAAPPSNEGHTTTVIQRSS